MNEEWWMVKEIVDKDRILKKIEYLIEMNVPRFEVQDDRGGSGSYILLY